ncbi:CAF17-like 4Fe-4S cluster assembly/insertion protein YgfZ [Granulicella arctica]|uniref:CAF17-like 4Fe-4S cluster assembly/insertion protein YgfZ n=1 Tax=Granulicella arctica TaxID=940613 RepID=UPI0021E0FAE7|nr:folate-binding protein [Granulicella arctica]
MSLTAEIKSDAVPASQEAQLQTLLYGAGVAPLNHLGWISVTGEDRVRWLNGMVTNSIQELKPGEGNYNFILSAQGRIQGTAYAFAQPESILLQTDRTQIPGLAATLDRFIIMDDVELTDITATLTGVALVGPKAPELLAQLGLEVPGALSLQSVRWHESAVVLVGTHGPVVPRFELWTDDATAESLTAALTNAGADTATPEALESLRILEGTPLYGTDIRNTETAKELPQETAQTRALHFAKGCYLGQEIVERIRSRGNVHRTFTGFRLAGTAAPGTPIEADGKPVGELTSIAAISLPTGIQHLGLGYIRREALDRNAALTCAGIEIQAITLPVNLSS